MSFDRRDLIKELKQAAENEFKRANTGDSVASAGNCWLFERSVQELENQPADRTVPINQNTIEAIAENLIPRWDQLDRLHQRVAKEQILDGLNSAWQTTHGEDDTE
ncbi:hypothetical protein AB0X98_01025 [Rothia koreensis]|uniref:hypothetical protein n=1 Tax=Rothia koreensis TaxID=592378 RepID=UPI003F299DF0